MRVQSRLLFGQDIRVRFFILLLASVLAAFVPILMLILVAVGLGSTTGLVILYCFSLLLKLGVALIIGINMRHRFTAVDYIFILPLVGVLFVHFYVGIVSPAQAWDALSFWFRDAAFALHGHEISSLRAKNMQPNSMILYFAASRQFASLIFEASEVNFIILDALLGYLAMFFLIWEGCRLQILHLSPGLITCESDRISPAPIVAILVLMTSIPLLENHFSLLGYVESFYIVGFVLLLVTLSSVRACKAWSLVFISLVTSIVYVVMIKDVGVLHAIVIFTAFCLPLVLRDNLCLEGIALLIFLLAALLFGLVEESKAIDPLLNVGNLTGVPLALVYSPIEIEMLVDFFFDFIRMIFINLSFGLWGLFFLVLISWLGRPVFLSRLVVYGLIFVMALTAGFDIFHLNSHIGSDTSGSRALLVIMSPCVLLVSIAWPTLERSVMLPAISERA